MEKIIVRKNNEKFNPNINYIDSNDVTYIVSDIQTKANIKRKLRNKYLKIYSVKEKKKKRKCSKNQNHQGEKK